MKRQFTVFSGLLLFAGVAFSQNALVVPSAQLVKGQNTIAPYNGVIKDEVSNTTKALGATLWSSDFSDPSDWTMTTAGQGTWEIGLLASFPQMAQYMGNMASTTVANGFGYFNGIQHLLASSVDPQDASLVTGEIDFTGNMYAEISFEQRYRAFNTDDIFVEFSPDGGTTWTISQPVNTTAVGNGPSIQSTLNLVFNVNNATNGVFRFRWVNTSDSDTQGSGYAWAIDDVVVRELADYDLASTYSFYHTQQYQYTQIPEGQIAPIIFRAGIKNQGSADLTNVKLVLDINSGASTEESNAVTIVSNAVDTLEATFTPTAVGAYTVAQSLTMNETDDNPANNTLSNVTFAVTPWTYAIDRNTSFAQYPLDGLSFGGTPVVISGVGMSFDVVENQDLYAVDFRLFTGTEVGSEVYAEVYEVNPNATELSQYWTGPIAETEFFTLANTGQISSIQTVNLLTPYTVEAGKTYMVLLNFSGVVEIATSGTNTTSQSWLKGNHANVWGTYSAAPVVRANFDPSVSVASVDALEGVKVYPNPSTGLINISNDLNVENTIVVTDITGKQVAAKTASSATTIDLSNVGTGVYIVEVANENGKKVERVVVR